ncbi:MAG: hypothetical protein ABJA67_13215 [Chthonomonadales bacterium]
MTLTIELTEAERIHLNALAEKSGTDVDSVVHKLFGGDEPAKEKPKMTPKELWDELESAGVIGPPWGEDLDGPELARKLRNEGWSRTR